METKQDTPRKGKQRKQHGTPVMGSVWCAGQVGTFPVPLFSCDVRRSCGCSRFPLALQRPFPFSCFCFLKNSTRVQNCCPFFIYLFFYFIFYLYGDASTSSSYHIFAVQCETRVGRNSYFQKVTNGWLYVHRGTHAAMRR